MDGGVAKFISMLGVLRIAFSFIIHTIIYIYGALELFKYQSSTFLHCVFSNVSSNCLLYWMQSCIDCICWTFLHYVFSNVSLNGLPQMMQKYIDCICLPFLHYVFSNVSSNHLPERMQTHIITINP